MSIARDRWRTFNPAYIALMLLGLSGCPNSGHQNHPVEATPTDFRYSGDAPLSIFCTTGQVADMVRNIAGPHADVVALMGPGIDPHQFTPKPSDVLRLRQADIVFYNGLHLEGRIAETLEQLGRRKAVVAVTDGLVAAGDPRLLKPTEFGGYYDPHVWHDVDLWSSCVDYVAEQLADFDPDRADDYRANAKAYRQQLAELDAECRDKLGSIPAERRLLVTAHDAFGYFSKAYDLETMGLKGISTEDEADFEHLDEVRRIIVERKIPTVFVESSTSPRLVNQLIEECGSAGHEVHVGDELYSDAMGPEGSGAEYYSGMIRANVEAIANGLGGD